jgi:hypothetical protein
MPTKTKRTYTSISASGSTIRREYTNGVPTGYFNEYPYNLRSSLTNLIVGNTLPHYKSVIASGSNATNARTGTLWTFSAEQGGAIITDEFSVWKTEKTFVGQCNIDSSTIEPVFSTVNHTAHVAKVNALAGVDIYNAISQAQTTLQSVVIAGEAVKSASTIVNGMKAILTGFKKCRRSMLNSIKGKKYGGNFDEADLKKVTSLYLSTVYGLMPLISDVDSAMKTIARLQYKPLGMPISGKASFVVNTPLDTIQGVAGVPVHWTGNISTKYECRCKCFLLLNDISGAADTSRTLGGGLQSFVPSVYELLPYSFLADYVSNLGSLITALSVRSFNLGWSWTTTCISQVLNGVLVKNDDQRNNKKLTIFAPGTLRIGNKSWSRSSGIPSPDIIALSFEIPSLKQSINSLILGIDKLFT